LAGVARRYETRLKRHAEPQHPARPQRQPPDPSDPPDPSGAPALRARHDGRRRGFIEADRAAGKRITGAEFEKP